jgi:hypothetical protein
MSLYDALELDMALRAAIACSADLGHAIDNLSNALTSSATLSEAENLVADVFIDAYTEAATMIVYLEELAEDEATLLDTAIAAFYEDIENGETYTDALADNTDLEEAVEINSALEELLIEFYDAIEEGESYTDALAEYETDIEVALDDAVYLIVDITVQSIEDDVQETLYEEGIEEALAVLYSDLEDGETLSEALEHNFSLQAAIGVSTDLNVAVYDLWEAIEEGETFTDAYAEYETEIESAVAAAAEYIVENDFDL